MCVLPFLPSIPLLLSCSMYWPGADASWDHCGLLNISSRVVNLGSPVTASCHVDALCLQWASEATPASLTWTLNGKVIPGSSQVVVNQTESSLTIPRVNGKLGTLNCYLLHRGVPHLLGTISFQAGVPPTDLHILTCVVIWIINITCSWDPGPESQIATAYTLHVREDIGRCDQAFAKDMVCHPSKGHHHCAIPISRMNAFYSIWVTGQNHLGWASSPALCRLAAQMVKLTPPEVHLLTSSQRCLMVRWKPPVDGLLPEEEAEYEIRYRTQQAKEEPWQKLKFTVAEREVSPKRLCNLSWFSNYTVQMRARYPSMYSHWSDWSPEKTAMTEQAAPSKGPAFWWRVQSPDSNEHREIMVMWKPLKLAEAHGRILGYRILSQMKGKEKVLLQECSVEPFRCILPLSKEEYTLFLTAYNALGESPATKLLIPAADQSAPVPLIQMVVKSVDDHSLRVRWEHKAVTESTIYILEWSVVAEHPKDGYISWDTKGGNITEAVIQEYIEPGCLYELSVYALHDGATCAKGSLHAYSREQPPRRAPKVTPTQIWKSQVELEWGEIPIEDQRGVILSYQLFYQEEGSDSKVVTLNSSSRHCCLYDLSPGTQIHVYLTISNSAGGANSSSLIITTRNFDHSEVVFLVSCALAAVALLLMAAVAVCMYHHQTTMNQTPARSQKQQVMEQLLFARKRRIALQNLMYMTSEQKEKLQMRLSFSKASTRPEMLLGKQGERAVGLDVDPLVCDALYPEDSYAAYLEACLTSRGNLEKLKPPEPGLHVPKECPPEVEYSSVIGQAYGLQCRPAYDAYRHPIVASRHQRNSSPSDPRPSSSLTPSPTTTTLSDSSMSTSGSRKRSCLLTNESPKCCCVLKQSGSPVHSTEFPLLRALLGHSSGPPSFMPALQLPSS